MTAGERGGVRPAFKSALQREAEERMREAGIAGPKTCSCGGATVPAHDGLPARCFTCGKRKR
jgi:hypothetical protein